MDKINNIQELGIEIARREGGKVGVNIAQISEVLAIMSDMEHEWAAQNKIGYPPSILLRMNGDRRAKIATSNNSSKKSSMNMGKLPVLQCTRKEEWKGNPNSGDLCWSTAEDTESVCSGLPFLKEDPAPWLVQTKEGYDTAREKVQGYDLQKLSKNDLLITTFMIDIPEGVSRIKANAFLKGRQWAELYTLQYFRAVVRDLEKNIVANKATADNWIDVVPGETYFLSIEIVPHPAFTPILEWYPFVWHE